MLSREVEKKIRDHDAQLEHKAEKVEVEKTNIRISNIVANNGNGTKDSEIVDARGIEDSLYQNINKIDRKSVETLSIYAITGKNLINTTKFEGMTFEDFKASDGVIYLDPMVRLQNGVYYKTLIYFTDGTYEDGTGSGCQYRNNEEVVFSKPPGNAGMHDSLADTVNNIKISFNSTGTTNHTGKTIDYIMLIKLGETNDYEPYFINYKSNVIVELETDINNIENESNYLYKDTFNKFNASKSKVGYYIYNSNINKYTDDSKSVTDYIEIDSTKVISQNLGYTVSGLAYDENKIKLGAFQIAKFYDFTTKFSNARYCILDYNTVDKDKLVIKSGNETPNKYIKNKVLDFNSVENSNNNMINWWEDKIGDSLGDSLTEQRFFQLYTTYYLNLKRFSCHGIGGTKLSGNDSNAMWQDVRINALSEDANFITILGGQNDGDVTIGEVSKTNIDINTYVGALNTIIDKIYKKYNGNIQIILCTPFYVPSEGDNGERFIKLGNAVKGVAQLHGLPVADFGGLSGANKYVKDIYWGTDKTHPLEIFYKEKITPILVETLNKVKPINFEKCNYVSRNLDQG